MNERIEILEKTIHDLIRLLAQTAPSASVGRGFMDLGNKFVDAQYEAARKDMENEAMKDKGETSD